MKCPEVHIYDNDVKSYQQSINEIKSRNDGSWGVLTKKHEIENYLHSDAIEAVYGVTVDTDLEDVPKRFAEAYYEANKDKLGAKWKDGTAKSKLSKVFTDKMTNDLLEDRDPEGEIKSWFDRMALLLH